MQRNLRYFTDGAERIGMLFSASGVRVVLGLTVASVVLPTAAYALWADATASSSVTSGEATSNDSVTRAVQSQQLKSGNEPGQDTGSQQVPSSQDAIQPQGADNTMNMRLEVNGQDVPLPSQGTISKRVTNQSGTTTIDVSVQSSASGTSQSVSNTSTTIELRSTTQSGGTVKDQGS